MLELSHEPGVNADAWDTADAKVDLPETIGADFFAAQGPMPIYRENNRGFHRFFLRGKAVLKRRETRLGTYTKDVSRQGVGFLSPVQLLPKERIHLQLPNGTQFHLEVARCRRVSEGCFECGARFVP